MPGTTPQRTCSPTRRRLRRAGRKIAALLIVAAIGGGLILSDRLGLFGRAPQDDHAAYGGRQTRVVRVHDGDTFEVAVPDGTTDHTDVRFWGVDTPELAHRPGEQDQHYAREAAEFVQRLCEGKRVRLDLEPGRSPRGKHGRLLAWVYLPDGRLLNGVLVAAGYGYADPRFPHSRQDEFARLQKQAMRDGRGLWQAVTPDDLPYYYRGKLTLPERER
ncbi:MAG: thermonuclease family protein [Phycisphaerae bacterium]|nr:thermonuclease family protein [Phycisphaerae bacterium]